MTVPQILSHVKDCVHSLEVYDGSERFSLGTAFAIDETGTLITAAHVITGGKLPVRREEIIDPELRVLSVSPHMDITPYQIVLCGVNVEGKFTNKPYTLDFAILRPKESRSNVSYLQVEPALPNVGESVLMSGFSEEMEAPFGVSKNLSPADFPYPEHRFKQKIDRITRLLMHKSGMIGSTYGYSAYGPNDSYRLEAMVLYIDNAMHCGASGGPIVNMKGHVIGILVERSTVELNYDPDQKARVPSGTAVALSINFISPFYPAFLSCEAPPIFGTMTVP